MLTLLPGEVCGIGCSKLTFEIAVAFTAMFALDFIWVYYTHATVAGQKFKASATAALIQLFSGVSVLAYTADPWALTGTVSGAFIGTWLAMKFSGTRRSEPEHHPHEVSVSRLRETLASNTRQGYE